jgi:hypothetical protein
MGVWEKIHDKPYYIRALVNKMSGCQEIIAILSKKYPQPLLTLENTGQHGLRPTH